MKVHPEDVAEFEDLDEARRRVDDEFSLLIQRMREGSVPRIERLRIEAQQLHTRHQGILRKMLDTMVP